MEPLSFQAARLEELLPLLMRSIYRPGEDEPLADLPLGQLRVVRVLFEGSRNASELAQELGLTQGAVTQLVQRLEDSGLVERSTDEGDRRVRRISLSAQGLSQMEARRERRRAQAEAALAQIPADRRADVLASLEALIRACDSAPV